MSNFKLIKKQIDIKPFLEEIAKHEDYWETERARSIPVHKETLCMPLTRGVLEEGKAFEDSHQQKNTFLYTLFPYTTAWLRNFAEEQNASLSRINIIMLDPEGKVYGHYDRGEYYAIRDRYHLVLQSKKGTKMSSGKEECIMHEGELWWFDNKKFHEVFNLSTQPRIHIVFDLLPDTTIPLS